MLGQMIPETEIDLESVHLAGITRWDIPAGNLQVRGLDGGWFPLPDPNLESSFSNRYQYQFNLQPHPLSALAYDAVVVVSAIVGRRGGQSQRIISTPDGFFGAYGKFRFNSDGTTDRALAIAEIRNATKFVISPAPRTFLRPGS